MLINAGDLFTRAGGNCENSICIKVEAGEMCFTRRELQEAISHPSSAEGKLLKRFWEPFKKEKMEFHLGENVTLYCSGFWFSTKNDKQNNVTLLTQ